MNKRIVLVAAAALLAVIGTYAVYSYGHNADRRAAAGIAPATVLVATKRIPTGTTWAEVVKGNYLTAEKVPADSAPSSALPSTGEAAIGVNAVTQADITPGTIVLREAFGTKTAQTGVLSIPKGMIAVSVQLASNQDVASFVGPNSQVVVLVTSRLDDKKTATRTGEDHYITRTLVPRAGVLAVSQSSPTDVSGAKAGDTASQSSVLVTLALSQADAQRLILGQKIGELYLGLLSASSVVATDDPGVDNTGVFRPSPIFLK